MVLQMNAQKEISTYQLATMVVVAGFVVFLLVFRD
jgi:hypothetical protein